MMNSMEMKNSETGSVAFRNRYNRNVSVKQGRIQADNGELVEACAEITHKGKTFRINEFLIGNKTDYVIVTIDDNQYRFKTYLEGEVFVADKIAKD